MMNRITRAGVDVFFQAVTRGWVMATCVHEYAHLVAIRLLGGSAVIKSGDLNHANWVYMIADAGKLPLVYLAGGFSTGVIYLLLSIGDSDPETRPIMVGIGASQMLYGFLEALWYITGYSWVLSLGGAVVAVGVYLPMLYLWICLVAEQKPIQ